MIWKSNMPPEQWNYINGIQGWLTTNEANMLYALAKESEHAIVEIGVWKGRSGCCLGVGSLAGHNVQVYHVDPFDGGDSAEHIGNMFAGMPIGSGTLEEFKTHIEHLGLGEICHPVVARSQEAYRHFFDHIGLLFIDGSHEYDAARTDYETWGSLVVPGGVIALHDVHETWPGPHRLGQELRQLEWAEIEQNDSLLMLRKPKP